MNDIRNFLMNALLENPKIKNNPKAQEYLQVIFSGNSQEGEKIAEDLCKTYGVSKEDAVSKAKVFFNLK